MNKISDIRRMQLLSMWGKIRNNWDYIKSQIESEIASDKKLKEFTL